MLGTRCNSPSRAANSRVMGAGPGRVAVVLPGSLYIRSRAWRQCVVRGGNAIGSRAEDR